MRRCGAHFIPCRRSSAYSKNGAASQTKGDKQQHLRLRRQPPAGWCAGTTAMHRRDWTAQTSKIPAARPLREKTGATTYKNQGYRDLAVIAPRINVSPPSASWTILLCPSMKAMHRSHASNYARYVLLILLGVYGERFPPRTWFLVSSVVPPRNGKLRCCCHHVIHIVSQQTLTAAGGI